MSSQINSAIKGNNAQGAAKTSTNAWLPGCKTAKKARSISLKHSYIKITGFNTEVIPMKTIINFFRDLTIQGNYC